MYPQQLMPVLATEEKDIKAIDEAAGARSTMIGLIIVFAAFGASIAAAGAAESVALAGVTLPVLTLLAFFVILPLLGVIEKPLPRPTTIEEDFDAHYPPKSDTSGQTANAPAE